RRAADGTRVADGGLRERRADRGCVWSGAAHAGNSQSTAAHRSAALGDGIRVPLQVGRVLLLDAAADGSEVGDSDTDHLSREGIRRGAAARVRDLLVSGG